MFAIVTEPVSGPVDEVIGTFDFEELAGKYLEKNGWHKSIGRWWTKGQNEYGTNRAMIHPVKSPNPPPSSPPTSRPKLRHRKRK